MKVALIIAWVLLTAVGGGKALYDMARWHCQTPSMVHEPTDIGLPPIKICAARW